MDLVTKAGSVLNFRVAVNSGKDKVNFFECTVWDKRTIDYLVKFGKRSDKTNKMPSIRISWAELKIESWNNKDHKDLKHTKLKLESTYGTDIQLFAGSGQKYG